MKEIIVDSVVESIPVVTDFVNEQLEIMDCPMKIQMQLAIVIDELLANIVHYAYGSEKGTIVVQMESQENPQAIMLTFMDQGVPYNPLEHEEPDTTLSAEEREIGGLGILLVKKSVDDIWYEYKEEKNILGIRKEIKK